MTLIERARQLRPYIVQAAQVLEDDIAIKCPELYDKWNGAGIEYKKDYKLRYDGKLYKVLLEHVSQESWTPKVAASLFTVIDEEHKGTLEDPIPYGGNMEIFNNKYYIEDNIIYLCIRDSGTALHNALKELVGIYVEIVEI